jgi:hypothetical protein
MPPRKSYLLRLSPQLYADLERWASDELRSVNAQIEFLLIDAVRRAAASPDDVPADDESA